MTKSRRKAAFDFEKLIAGGSAPAPWVPFSCLSKRKEPKRRTPGRFAAQTTRGALRASLRPGARLTRRAHKTRRGLDQESRENSRPGSVLGSLQRGWEQPISNLHAAVFSSPRSRRRASQPERGLLSEHLFESSRVVGGRRVAQRPLGREAQGVFGSSGRPFLSWLSFGRTKESHPGCRGGATRN